MALYNAGPVMQGISIVFDPVVRDGAGTSRGDNKMNCYCRISVMIICEKQPREDKIGEKR